MSSYCPKCGYEHGPETGCPCTRCGCSPCQCDGETSRSTLESANTVAESPQYVGSEPTKGARIDEIRARVEQGYPCEEVIPCPVCDDRAWLFTLVDRAAGLLREYRDRELDEYTHEMYENVVVFLREMGVSE